MCAVFDPGYPNGGVRALVFDCTRERLLSLLDLSFGRLLAEVYGPDEPYTYSNGHSYVSIGGGDEHRAHLAVEVFKSRLWSSDLAFARYLAQALGCRVRCEPGDDFPGVNGHPYVCLEISGASEQLMLCLDPEDVEYEMEVLRDVHNG